MRLLGLALICCCQLVWAAERTVEFNRDVRPILSDKCYTCHGPDAAAKKVPVRLDSEAAARPVIAKIVPRITSEKKFLLMPPPASGLHLKPQEIEVLRAWVEQGAPWQRHWSFLPPKRAEVPAGVHPIDYFVQQRLQQEGLKPAPEAPRETLLRRVSLDLTGLPPTPAELDAFLRDSSPHAYEAAVDRLLASPRYGERMAARWLDAARYADTNGYQYDAERHMWRWRDWVIDAFNRNEPFNQFTVEQIAGDLLPHATRDQVIATGFNRNHRANTEDGIIPEEYAVEYVVDRVETTSTVFLGVTLGCARCHNHKYDPFTQKEFYQVFAYFNNVPELGRAIKYGNSPPVVPAPTREQAEHQAQLDQRIAAVEQFLKQHDAELQKAQTAWHQALPASPGLHYAPSAGLQPLDTKPQGSVPSIVGPGGESAVFDGHTYLDGGAAGAFDIDTPFTLSAWLYSDAVPQGAIVSKMADDPKGKGYGIYANQGHIHVHLTSTYADDAIRIDTEEALTPKQWHHVLVTYAGAPMAENVKIYLDGQLAHGKVGLDSLYRPFRNAGRTFKEPFRVGAGGGAQNRFHGNIGGVHLYNRVVTGEELAQLAVGQSVQLLPANHAVVRGYFLDHAAPASLHDAWSQSNALRTEREKLVQSFPTVMVMAERPVPKDTFLLLRGAYDKHGEKVQRGVPAVLPPLPEGAPNNRLGFAQWLVSPDNPLLARVTVNRFWQMYFGTGLVKTTEDFGVQGEWPSHPELLDWLATEFVRTGWDVKALQKLIVTSSTYRQSSQASPELLQRDPENRLLARGPRFRLSAEMIRDQALYIGGLLNEKVGGPSVKPYQPAGLWKEIAMQDMDYVQDHGPDLYRRSLYTFWKRTIAPPTMVNFDSANREACVVRENRTNTPLQALNLMNDVTFLEAARFLGQRMMKEGGADPLAYGFRLVTGRRPADSEVAILRSNLQYHRDYFASHAEKARAFLHQGESPSDPTLNPTDLAAYAGVGSLLLNLDETVTKE